MVEHILDIQSIQNEEFSNITLELRVVVQGQRVGKVPGKKLYLDIFSRVMVLIVHGFPNDISALRVRLVCFTYINSSLNGLGKIPTNPDVFLMCPQRPNVRLLSNFDFEFCVKCCAFDPGAGFA